MYGFRKNAAEDVCTLSFLNQTLVLRFPQLFMMQGRDAARFVLHHIRGDVAANYYIQGTNSLAPVRTRLGTPLTRNETYEVRLFFVN